MRRNLVAIGASAGGIEALSSIVRELPADFPAAICAVLHVSPDSPGILDLIIRRASKLPVVAVAEKEPLRPGVVYLPVPDRHLIVEPSVVRSSRGPKENRFRPAVDPLFRSAAQTFGPRAVGVVLTGGLDDGTSGLWTIKQLGGMAIVQDPSDALVPSMPRSARTYVTVDHCVPLSELPRLLTKLVTEDLMQAEGYSVPEPTDIEVNIAKEERGLTAGVEKLGGPSIYSCPECHGVLLRLEEGARVRFRCHTGHAYSGASLLSEMDRAIDETLWDSVRALQEKELLLRHLEEHARAQGDRERAEALARLADEAEWRAERVRQVSLTGPRYPSGGEASLTLSQEEITEHK